MELINVPLMRSMRHLLVIETGNCPIDAFYETIARIGVDKCPIDSFYETIAKVGVDKCPIDSPFY